MKNIVFKPSGVCAREISFNIDENNKIHDLKFIGGCNGNLKAISKLCEGMDAKEVSSILEGNECGFKGTSCADQLSRAIKEAK